MSAELQREAADPLGGGSFDVRQLFGVLLSRAWVIVLFGVVGICAGLAYFKNAPRTYYAQAVIEVDPIERKVVRFQDDQSSGVAKQEMMESLVAKFRSRAFLQNVIEHNRLLQDLDFMSRPLTGEPPKMESAVNMLMGSQNVRARYGTWFIDVGATHPNPLMAKKLADALADGFIRESIERKAESSQAAIDFLVGEAERLMNQLQAAEVHLQEYVEQTDSISLEERQDTVVANLKNLSTQLLAAKAERLRIETDDEEIKRLTGDPQALLTIPSVANHPTITDLKRKIEYYESQIPILALRYTEKHPKMIQTRAQIKEARASLLEAAAKLPPLLHSAYEAAVATEEKFQIAVKEQEKAAMELNKQSIAYKVMSRDVDISRALYESILTRLKEAQIAQGIESSNVRIFERAVVPFMPMQARKAKVLVLALAAGLAAGVGLCVGLHMLDSSLQTVEQAERITGMPVIGAIPRASTTALSEAGLALHKDPASIVAESLRTLRTALHIAGRSRGRSTVLFTSAMPGEGKTFCSINYAISLAQQGTRTLLIDADLRAPVVEGVLLRKGKHLGLSDYLGQGGNAQLIIHATDVPNLFVTPAGALSRNPAELLSSPPVGVFMKEAKAMFDRIVIDTAPVIAVSDTLLFVEHADMVCLVVHSYKTPRRCVLRAATLLAGAGSRPVGLVMNQMRTLATGYSLYVGKYGTEETYGARQRAGSGETEAAEEEAAQLQPEPRNTAV